MHFTQIHLIKNVEKGLNPSDIVKVEIKYHSGEIKIIDN